MSVRPSIPLPFPTLVILPFPLYLSVALNLYTCLCLYLIQVLYLYFQHNYAWIHLLVVLCCSWFGPFTISYLNDVKYSVSPNKISSNKLCPPPPKKITYPAREREICASVCSLHASVYASICLYVMFPMYCTCSTLTLVLSLCKSIFTEGRSASVYMTRTVNHNLCDLFKLHHQ